jgi:hypothetical protein
MIIVNRFGRVASAAIISSGLFFATVGQAADVTDEQIKIARGALDALGATTNFDNILPTIAEQLKSQLIQASPNYQEIISTTVDDQALALAGRRADLEKEAAAIYAKTFTEDELKAITAFYSSDAGKKLLKDGPIATRELFKAADIWASGIQRDMAKATDEALKKVLPAPTPVEAAPAAEAPAAKPKK